MEFGTNSIANIKSNYFYNTDIIKKNRYLLCDFDCFKSRRHRFYNINQNTTNTISDRCNMANEQYINQSMSLCERKRSINIARNPFFIDLLDCNKNHPLIRKFLHLPFNN